MDDTTFGNELLARFGLGLNRALNFCKKTELLDKFRPAGDFLLLFYRIVAILFMQAAISIYGRLDKTHSGGSYV